MTIMGIIVAIVPCAWSVNDDEHSYGDIQKLLFAIMWRFAGLAFRWRLKARQPRYSFRSSSVTLLLISI